MGDNEDALFALFLLAAAVVGIVIKPGIALVICGLVAILAGLLSLATGNFFGLSFGATGIVSGIGLIGFGRLIAFVEQLLAETRRTNDRLADLHAVADRRPALPDTPSRTPPPRPKAGTREEQRWLRDHGEPGPNEITPRR